MSPLKAWPLVKAVRFLIVAILCLGTDEIHGAPVVDQELVRPGQGGWWLAEGVSHAGQTVTAGIPGYLVNVELWATRREDFLTPWLLDIHAVLAGEPTGLILSSTVVMPEGFPVLPNEGFPPTLNVALALPVFFHTGDQFAIVLHPEGANGIPSLQAGVWTFASDYDGGKPVWGSSDTDLATTEGFDFLFRTYVEPVPEPSSFVLAALGLMGLVVWRRRKQHSLLDLNY